MLNIKIIEVYSTEVKSFSSTKDGGEQVQNIRRTLIPDEQPGPQLIARRTSTYKNPRSYDSPHNHTHPHCEGDGGGTNQTSNGDVGAGELRLR